MSKYTNNAINNASSELQRAKCSHLSLPIRSNLTEASPKWLVSIGTELRSLPCFTNKPNFKKNNRNPFMSLWLSKTDFKLLCSIWHLFRNSQFKVNFHDAVQAIIALQSAVRAKQDSWVGTSLSLHRAVFCTYYRSLKSFPNVLKKWG